MAVHHALVVFSNHSSKVAALGTFSLADRLPPVSQSWCHISSDQTSETKPGFTFLFPSHLYSIRTNYCARNKNKKSLCGGRKTLIIAQIKGAMYLFIYLLTLQSYKKYNND